jgi:putative DNA primase/helicase
MEIVTEQPVMTDGISQDEYFKNIGDLWARFSIIPLRYRDKVPAVPSWTEFQQRRPTYEEAEAWFDRPQRFNVGVVTGTVSGIFVLDCDSPDALAWAEEYMPVCTMRVRTAKGMHLYFPYSGDRPLRNKVRTKFQGRELQLDIRAQGGYVVGPGSVHPSGAIYTRECWR